MAEPQLPRLGYITFCIMEPPYHGRYKIHGMRRRLQAVAWLRTTGYMLSTASVSDRRPLMTKICIIPAAVALSHSNALFTRKNGEKDVVIWGAGPKNAVLGFSSYLATNCGVWE